MQSFFFFFFVFLLCCCWFLVLLSYAAIAYVVRCRRCCQQQATVSFTHDGTIFIPLVHTAQHREDENKHTHSGNRKANNNKKQQNKSSEEKRNEAKKKIKQLSVLGSVCVYVWVCRARKGFALCATLALSFHVVVVVLFYFIWCNCSQSTCRRYTLRRHAMPLYLMHMLTAHTAHTAPQHSPSSACVVYNKIYYICVHTVVWLWLYVLRSYTV